MSHITIVNRSQLVAAATAITAVVLLTLSPPAQAHPVLPLAPACDQYRFNGNFSLKQANGDTVVFSSIGTYASGNATATGGSHGPLRGEIINGGITLRYVGFQIRWSANSLGDYTGGVGDDGFVHGNTHDVYGDYNSDGNWSPSVAHWDSTVPLVCDTPAAPPAPAAAPPPPQNPLLSEPATQVPNRREIPPIAPTATPTP
jgi:hypothetical protein